MPDALPANTPVFRRRSDEHSTASFMFATGIENSIPTIDGGRKRVDEMAKCGHYDRWREDFALVREMGIGFLRYGPPLHTTLIGPGRYDWDFADETLGVLRADGIVPIVDLCHFGLPDWMGNFQNPDFPVLFADYARAFAARFPWVQLYTPVNEMFICATFSARYGWWNEQATDDRSFVTALKHIVKANRLAMQAILEIRRDAIFVQSESAEQHHAETPDAWGQTQFNNALRFLSLDLNYGRPVEAPMYQYITDNGMTRDEYEFFQNGSLKRHCIMGTDYYATNEHLVAPDGHTRSAGDVYGYATIIRQYHSRYRVPVMHTETNLNQGPNGDEAVMWMWKQWANVMRLFEDGIPILGFTWYSLTDQVDWDTALREDNGNVNPLGLYDLDRRIRPVGEAYARCIRAWGGVLPTRSLCLQLPLTGTADYGGSAI